MWEVANLNTKFTSSCPHPVNGTISCKIVCLNSSRFAKTSSTHAHWSHEGSCKIDEFILFLYFFILK